MASLIGSYSLSFGLFFSVFIVFFSVRSLRDTEVLDKKIKIISTNRGGKITVHNPGQKIVYFALDLNKRKRDVRKFINVVEKSIIELLAIYL